MSHPVVHFELSGPDDAGLAAFYTALFGWSAQAVPGAGYTLIDTAGGTGINGGIERAAAGQERSTFYIQTEDLQADLDKINLVGGKTVTPVTDIPGLATYALFEDPDGLVVGLVLATGGEAAGPAAGQGAPVDWFELQTRDAARSHRFYTEVFGWTVTSGGPGGYGMVSTGAETGIQGGIGQDSPGQGSADQDSTAGSGGGTWATVYASVASVDAMLARAAELGGSRVYGPQSVDDHMQTGAVRDPAGNVVGVYHHEPH
jgi:predicted enzyme related to lactoylglutathione lyase